MRKLLVLMTTLALLLAATTTPAFAVGKNPPTSCGAGNVVSNFTTTTGGVGKEFSDNPGEELRNLKQFDVYPICHLDDPGQTP